MRRSVLSLMAAAALAPALVLSQGSALASAPATAPATVTAAATAKGPTVLGQRIHAMPYGANAPVGGRAASAPAGALLTYYGGRVVSHVQTVPVMYGAGVYRPYVSSPASPSMSTFLPAVTGSPFVDWLDGEYNTVTPSPAVGSVKTNQHIGRGTSNGFVQITPASSRNGSTITDAQIQSEIAAQIAAGTLPAPQADAAGNNNTEYVMFFPAGKSICDQGSCSMVAGGFCAYHGTIANAAGHGEVYYAVMPDFPVGLAGCGASPVDFNNASSVLSHELVETITDPEVGLATTYSPPLAWYDHTNGEIGDICNAQQGTFLGSDGVTYTVQKQFSNAVHDCIVSKPAPVVTSVTPPAVLQKAPFVVTFDHSVLGVDATDLTVEQTGTSTPLAGTLKCLNAASVVVSCSTGPLTVAQLTPTKALIAGEYYVVDVNKTSSGVHDSANLPVAATEVLLRAQTVFSPAQYPLKFGWGSVSNAAASGGSYLQDKWAGASTTWSFTGTSLSLVFWGGPDRGVANVVVTTPGQPNVTATLDTYAAVAGHVTVALPTLLAGSHTVKITANGTKNGTSTDTQVGLDGYQTATTSVTTWHPAATWSGGADVSTTQKTATLTVSFRGTGITWNALLGPNDGRAKVVIDGVTVATEDLYAAVASHADFTFGGLADTSHTVKITVLGTKQAASTDTAVTLHQITVL